MNLILSHSQALIAFDTTFWSFGRGLLFWATLYVLLVGTFGSRGKNAPPVFRPM